jgi:hypothetical protein
MHLILLACRVSRRKSAGLAAGYAMVIESNTPSASEHRSIDSHYTRTVRVRLAGADLDDSGPFKRLVARRERDLTARPIGDWA